MRLIDASVDNLEWAVKEAADILSKGGIVACPMLMTSPASL